MNIVALAAADKDLGLVAANIATKRAQSEANAMGVPVTVRDATTDKVIKTVKPKKAKAAKAKKATAKKTAAKSAAKPKAERKPRGMVIDILKLASRPNGVSPAELNKLTKWKGAPWKWLFSNPKKTGYADRWGYKFKVAEGKDGETRYCVTAK